MTTYVTSRRVALVAASGLLAALALSGAAQAITDNVFRYTTPKTGHFGINVMAMAPDGNNAGTSYLISWTDASLSADAFKCFNAGVNLPHGATMTRLSVWYTSGANSDPTIDLRRHPLAGGMTAPIAFGSISDDSGLRKQKNFVIADGPMARVNNAQYAYGFGVCVGSDTVFHGARVTYTYNHAGD